MSIDQYDLHLLHQQEALEKVLVHSSLKTDEDKTYKLAQTYPAEFMRRPIKSAAKCML